MTTYALSNGKTLVLEQDQDAQSPRHDGCLATMVFFHKRYNFGDEHDFSHDDYNSWDDFREHAFDDSDVVLPVFMMDHSGFTFRTHDFSDMGLYGHFDSGQLGFMYCTKGEVSGEFGAYDDETIEKAKKAMKGELEAYGQYVNGEIYGFILKNEDGDEADSCWGFYGDDITKNGVIDCLNQEDLDALYDKNPELRPDSQ